MIDNDEPLKKYIQCLIDNLDKNRLPKNLDLILSGGAFNGAYCIGTLIYLKELEKLDILNVNRVSGCSIGAILGVLYLTNNMSYCIEIYKNFLDNFRKELNIKFREQLIKKYVYEVFQNDNMESINDKLYITFYDSKKKEQIVISNYESRDVLIDCLIKTSHIPFMSGEDYKYKNNFVDGILPYIFKKSDYENLNDAKMLYVKLTTIKKLASVMNIKNEKNVYSRLLQGVVDIDEFFNKDKSDMCSYVNNWNIIDYGLYRSNSFMNIVILFIIDIIIIIKNKLDNQFNSYDSYNKIKINILDMFKDSIEYYLL